MNDKPDELHGHGGAYIVRDGKRVRLEEPTKDHPEGNRARDQDGRPLDAPPTQEAPERGRPRGSGPQ